MTTSRQVARRLMELAPNLFQSLVASMRTEREGDPLNLMQVHTLRALHRESRTFKELCARRNVAAPTLSRSIEAMVRRGWVERVPHPDDRRQLVLRITRDGQRELDAVDLGTQTFLAQRLDALTAHERASVDEALSILNRVFAPMRPYHDTKTVNKE